MHRQIFLLPDKSQTALLLAGCVKMEMYYTNY